MDTKAPMAIARDRDSLANRRAQGAVARNKTNRLPSETTT